MPRRNVPSRSASLRSADQQPIGGLGWARAEIAEDGEWLVRTVPGARTTKQYRCPGCDHEIRPGTGHVVAWPADEVGTAADRRHWHTGCWAGRQRRGPVRRC
jgi:hypothetical protein